MSLQCPWAVPLVTALSLVSPVSLVSPGTACYSPPWSWAVPGLHQQCPHGVPCVPRHSGLLSALGLALADVVHEEQEPCALPYGPAAFPRLDARLRELERRCRDALREQGFAP